MDSILKTNSPIHPTFEEQSKQIKENYLQSIRSIRSQSVPNLLNDSKLKCNLKRNRTLFKGSYLFTKNLFHRKQKSLSIADLPYAKPRSFIGSLDVIVDNEKEERTRTVKYTPRRFSLNVPKEKYRIKYDRSVNLPNISDNIETNLLYLTKSWVSLNQCK